MHPRNRHHGRYNLPVLAAASPELAPFIHSNPHDSAAGLTLDFSDPKAVKALNRALLSVEYGVLGWDVPDGYLCPPVPGRADYVHCLADLLAERNGGVFPPAERVCVLDLGVGANGIYPLVGHAEYGWSFIGVDVDAKALQSVGKILRLNDRFFAAIELRQQDSPVRCFRGTVKPGELIDASMCNPPFHTSAEDALKVASRKWQNLGRGRSHGSGGRAAAAMTRNFGGQANELWCEGGELAFVLRMIEESRQFATQFFWFSTLISKASNLPAVHQALRRVAAFESKTIDMTQGQKQSRFVAWTYLDRAAQALWRDQRWTAPESA